MRTSAMTPVWRSGDNLQEEALFSHHVDSRERSQKKSSFIARVCLLNHLTNSPSKCLSEPRRLSSLLNMTQAGITTHLAYGVMNNKIGCGLKPIAWKLCTAKFEFPKTKPTLDHMTIYNY